MNDWRSSVSRLAGELAWQARRAAGAVRPVAGDAATVGALRIEFARFALRRAGASDRTQRAADLIRLPVISDLSPAAFLSMWLARSLTRWILRGLPIRTTQSP